MIEIIKGNIFTTNRQVIVNTINCVGVMGAGIALECRLRYPEMFLKYQVLCQEKNIDIGKLWIYKAEQRWILNFPTKKHWKYPSKVDYLHAGLEKFMATYKERNIESIAFPLLGADRGGIAPEESLNIMVSYLQHADIPVDIYQYDPKASDDLFQKVQSWLKSKTIEEIMTLTGLRRNYVESVCSAMDSGNIYQLNQLANVKGIGIKTIEKVFEISRKKHEQTSLF
jgi:O-acetyl-ADP-ribose deacetylase (regulator of RNase III)